VKYLQPGLYKLFLACITILFSVVHEIEALKNAKYFTNFCNSIFLLDIHEGFLKLCLRVRKVRLILEGIFCRNLLLFLTILALLLPNCCSYYISLSFLYSNVRLLRGQKDLVLQSSCDLWEY